MVRFRSRTPTCRPIDEDRPGSPVIEIDLHETAVSDADLAQLATLTELQRLDLRKTRVGDAGVCRLATRGPLRS